MAEEVAPEVPMELETNAEVAVEPKPADDSDNGGVKRAREEDEEQNGEKKAKIEDEKSAEEQRLEDSGDGEGTVEEETKVTESESGDGEGKVEEETKVKESESGDGEGKVREETKVKESESGQIAVGPKTFGSSVEIFDYFYKLLHTWPANLNLNKYEHIVLLNLLKKGHLEPEKKIGKGVKAFQVRSHPQFRSRCFFLIREDDSVDDFSFRKCVDHISPLPENMQIKHDVNKALRGKGGGRGRGRGRGGRGRGGK